MRRSGPLAFGMVGTDATFLYTYLNPYMPLISSDIRPSEHVSELGVLSISEIVLVCVIESF
jgi:hypothetical protein